MLGPVYCGAALRVPTCVHVLAPGEGGWLGRDPEKDVSLKSFFPAYPQGLTIAHLSLPVFPWALWDFNRARDFASR